MKRIRQHLNFDHAPWAYGARTSYRLEASLDACPTDGWSTTDLVGHPLRKILAQVDSPTIPWRPWDQTFPHFLKERFFVTMRDEKRLDARDPLDPLDPWLPTTGSGPSLNGS